MEILAVILAILLVVLAWKIVKGLFGILITLAAVGLLVWGGMKLLGGDGPRRIK